MVKNLLSSRWLDGREKTIFKEENRSKKREFQFTQLSHHAANVGCELDQLARP